MWNSADESTKHTRSASKLAKQYPSQVLEVGKATETELLSFLRKHKVTGREAHYALKSMRKLHKSSHPNVHIRRYQQPSKNFFSSAKEFKTLCIAASKEHKIRISDEAIRHPRLTMTTVVNSTSLLGWLHLLPADDEANNDKDVDDEKQHQTYYLVHWKPTWEACAHIHPSVVAAFEKERHLLVLKKLFKDEAERFPDN
ncbi:hypothetical protein PHMEG_0003052 [Phytophthora megakarya]|uniref:Uncharacterized protein n=1 Tax=Phytophthora megakarya TaxID=4795 RepID=A0A225WXE1_9STRA|nr:hypothetical protein PHMEG_0003052 [Phytophthora megakarya]